jgi:hypothetical protein
MEEKKICAICLDPINNMGCLKPCKHTFCYSCIQIYVSTAGFKSCPICRSSIQDVVRPNPHCSVVSNGYFPFRYSLQYRSGAPSPSSDSYEQQLTKILTDEKCKLEEIKLPLSNKQIRRLHHITKELKSLQLY